MQAGLRTLLNGVLDFAGMFPPAKLPLHLALQEYRAHRAAPHAWLLGRFLCPANQLTELVRVLSSEAPAAPIPVALIAQPAPSSHVFHKTMSADLAALQLGERVLHDQLVLEGYEVRLPLTAASTSAEAAQLLAHVQTELRGHLAALSAVFVELPLTARWQEQVPELLRLVKQLAWPGLGVKLRCGGLDASAFPTAAQVAHWLVAVQQHDLAMKATAGLHHPLRRQDAALQSMMHGFVNVLSAAALLRQHALDELTVQALLETTAPADFHFDEQGLHWRGWSVPLSAITQTRQQRFLAFGSCSVVEPLTDLEALGWL